MCGIVGQVRAAGSVDPVLIERMCAAQEHRGPDSRGVHTSAGVGLGIQRLRVVDLATGDQPIYNEDRSIVLVLNGEIYNHAELRDQLRRRGHRFSTNGDTEVIAHLYEDEGPRCVERLHGMFAFALWDDHRRQLLLARDRVGKKPLFYAEGGGILTFASELHALMQDPAVPDEIDARAIDRYLAFGYVPAPLSAFAGVRKLMPATTLTYRDGTPALRRYWNLEYGTKRASARPSDLAEETRAAIRKAVRQRMVADVPVGAFLSGGIDSSAVVAAMSEASSEPVKTFTIGFEDERHNELPQARRVAAAFATDHHEMIVRPDAVDILPTMVRHYGEPFADSSAIPSFYLAQFARRHVTVALNGDGGDESFAGYQRYTTSMLLAHLDRLPAAWRRGTGGLAHALPANGDSHGRVTRATRWAGWSGLPLHERYVDQMSIFGARGRAALYAPEYAAFVGTSTAPDVLVEPWTEASGDHLLDQLLEVDVNTYLPGDLLVKMDIATMAFSLEARSPLLDHELMEFAATLPPGFKARGLQRKIGLRAALRGWVPDDILDGPKRGFSVPLARWLREQLGTYAREVLQDPSTAARGWFRQSEVQRLLDRHATGQEDNSGRIWALLALEVWHRERETAGRPGRVHEPAAAAA